MNVRIDKILCPVDFSTSSEYALNFAVAMAETYGAELVLLHVIEPPVYAVSGDYLDPEFSVEMTRRQEAASQKKLEEVEAGVRARYPRIRALSVSGAPFLGIVETARREQASLIVMGTQGRTGLAHMLIGSVAEKVVRKAPCPVLTVKHPDHDTGLPGETR